MKQIITFLLILLAQSLFAQENNVSIFHRLIIYNEQSEILIVNFKDSDIWVTPGFYQDSVQFIKEGLHKVASTYGLEVTNPEIRGIFSMRQEFSRKTEMSIRNIYSCKVTSGKLTTPKFLGDVKWAPIEDAIQNITYKSIKLFVKQIHDYPEIIWGGSVNVVRGDAIRDYQIIEEFYPLAK